jgi:hypothetical protein
MRFLTIIIFIVVGAFIFHYLIRMLKQEMYQTTSKIHRAYPGTPERAQALIARHARN